MYGLARNASKARGLAAQEIIPVIGSVQEPSAYLALIRDVQIDVVVDASGAMDGAFKLLGDLQRAGKDRLERAADQADTQQRLAFIYTSGMWVHGDSTDQVADLDPVGVSTAKHPSAKLVAWRPQLERDILSPATRGVLDVAVLRPALMYGGTSSIWGIAFGPIFGAAMQKQDTVKVQAEPDCMAALAHVDDVAVGYVKAVEKVHLLAGTGVVPIFDLQTTWENLGVILNAFAKHVGFKGKIETVSTADNAFAAAMSTSIKGDSTRARQLLDWNPTRIDGLTAGMEIYAGAFAAAQGGQ